MRYSEAFNLIFINEGARVGVYNPRSDKIQALLPDYFDEGEESILDFLVLDSESSLRVLCLSGTGKLAMSDLSERSRQSVVWERVNGAFSRYATPGEIMTICNKNRVLLVSTYDNKGGFVLNLFEISSRNITGKGHLQLNRDFRQLSSFLFYGYVSRTRPIFIFQATHNDNGDGEIGVIAYNIETEEIRFVDPQIPKMTRYDILLKSSSPVDRSVNIVRFKDLGTVQIVPVFNEFYIPLDF